MGNILNPSPGDLVDRQTILEVKLNHCGVEGNTGLQPVSAELMEQSPQKSVSRTKLLEKTDVDIQPVIREHEAIQQKLELDWFTKLMPDDGDKFDKMMSELSNVNAELWKLEDQARVLRLAPDKQNGTVIIRKAETLDAITLNNDLRAELVRKINALWRIDTQEKMYAA